MVLIKLVVKPDVTNEGKNIRVCVTMLFIVSSTPKFVRIHIGNLFGYQ